MKGFEAVEYIIDHANGLMVDGELVQPHIFKKTLMEKMENVEQKFFVMVQIANHVEVSIDGTTFKVV